MSSHSYRRRRTNIIVGFGVSLTAIITVLRLLTSQTAGSVRLEKRNFDEYVCAEIAEKRAISFIQRINHTCDDAQRQRSCQKFMSRHAIPELVNTNLAAGCDEGCQFHAIISEAGGEAINTIAFTAFLRAFIVTQPKKSKLYIWTLPWDEISLPDITLGCTPRTMSTKLGDGSWRHRIQIKSFDRADLGALNLLKMMIYRSVGNQFRLLRSMVRLSDLLRFHLLQKYGGIYVDSDVLLLHDLTPLCNSTFAYRWSDEDAENSAVFGCPKQCRFVNEYIRVAGATPLSYHPLKWRKIGRQGVSRWPVRLPTIVFDPVWLKEIGSDAYEPAEYIITKHEDFAKVAVNHMQIDSRYRAFPASLGYHWHGGYASIPENPDPDSTFSLLHNLACL